MSQLDIYDATGETRPAVLEQDPVTLVAGAWLASYASEHTRRAYARDLRAWLGFLAQHDVHPWEARRSHADVWTRLGAGYDEGSDRSVARRLAAVSSFYGYAVTEEVTSRNPFAHVRRPQVDKDASDTRGLTRDEAKAMLTFAHELGPRYRVVIGLMLLEGLRCDSVLHLRIEDLGIDRGHRVATVRLKGGKTKEIPLGPKVATAIDDLLALDGRTEGRLLVTRTGRPLTNSALFRMVRRCATLALLDEPNTVTPHSLRATFITLGLDTGVPLRDMQDAAGHADPRTTRIYDKARHNLDRHPTYALGSYLS